MRLAYPRRMRAPQTPPREPRPMRLASPGRMRAPRLLPSSPAPCASPPRDACARRDSAPGARLPARPAPRSALPSGRRACGGVSGGTDARASRLRALAARCRPTHSGALGSLYHTYPHGTTKEAGAKRGAGLAYSAVWSE
nr:transmembrane protein 14C isoform X1 [Vulpes vulpes]